MQTKTNKIKKVVIAGGGTAGWVAAAALSKQLGSLLDIVLVESVNIGTVGVGEATIPPMKAFHQLLGIDEKEFMRETQATFKLGILFENWRNTGDKYFHSFGNTGKNFYLGEFHDLWLYGKTKGHQAPFGDYCYETQAAMAGKFAMSENSNINYAYHLDATLYAKYLRKYSERHGVKCIEGDITTIAKNENTSYIESLTLASGEIINGDLFIDCTGFKGLLIEETLATGFQDWSHWLPCNSAAVVQTEKVSATLPYTRSIAHQSGWQWQIPLQHRVGNGLVFCDKFMSNDQAIEKLTSNIQGAMITEPRILKYRTGRRNKNWNKNCVALGLSSGFIEPLESTSIYMFMIGIIRLMKLFPFDGIKQPLVDEYNKQAIFEAEEIRDFIILHYHVTEREDSEFWRYCKNMPVPDTLNSRIELFKQSGKFYTKDSELFKLDSWVQVMLGQGIMPEQYHNAVHVMPDDQLTAYLTGLRNSITSSIEQLPSHQSFLKSYCPAKLDI